VKRHSIFIGMLGAALLAIGVFALTDYAARPAPFIRTTEEIKRITYEEVAPYLDAMMVAEGGMIYYECKGDNLRMVPNRRDPLETLARRASSRFFQGTRAISHHLKARGILPPANGSSPWGAFSLPEIKEEILPFFEEAKQAAVAEELTKEGDKTQADASTSTTGG